MEEIRTALTDDERYVQWTLLGIGAARLLAGWLVLAVDGNREVDAIWGDLETTYAALRNVVRPILNGAEKFGLPIDVLSPHTELSGQNAQKGGTIDDLLRLLFPEVVVEGAGHLYVSPDPIDGTPADGVVRIRTKSVASEPPDHIVRVNRSTIEGDKLWFGSFERQRDCVGCP